MNLANTSSDQDRTIGKLEDVAGLWSDTIEIIEDLDSRLSSALTDVSNLRAESPTQELERVKDICRDQEANLEAALTEIARLDSLVVGLRAEIEDLGNRLYRAKNGGES